MARGGKFFFDAAKLGRISLRQAPSSPVKPRQAPSSCRAAHGQVIDQQGRLADAHGHALAFLAAGADAAVELHIVADHGNPGQRIRAVADEGGALCG